MPGGQANAGDLAERMDAGIGPAGAVHRDRRPFKARERVFQQALDGYALSLPLPADETRAVVTDRELERTGQSATAVLRFSSQVQLSASRSGLHYGLPCQAQGA